MTTEASYRRQSFTLTEDGEWVHNACGRVVAHAPAFIVACDCGKWDEYDPDEVTP